MPGKKTPAQNIMLRRLQKAGALGLSVDQLHDLTLSGLVRRGHATVSFGRAYAANRLEQPDDDFDGAA